MGLENNKNVNLKQPKVSVLMTAYNREKYIAEAIESVLASTFTDFELIVVDDCSSDQTVAIARSFESKDSRIKVYVNEKNLGDYPNRNRAAEYAVGEFIYYLDSDDMLVKDGLEKLLGLMNKFPEVQFAMYSGEITEEQNLNPKEAIYRHFFVNPFLVCGPSGTFLKRKFLEDTGRYPVKYGPACDMYFNLKAASSVGVLLIPYLFVNYRIHEGQEQNDKYKYLYNNFNYLKDALNKLPLPLEKSHKAWLLKKSKRRFVTNIFKYFIKTGNFSKTIRAIKLAEFKLGDFLEGVFH